MDASIMSLDDATSLAGDIRALARRAAECLMDDRGPRLLALRRMARPVDYMRYAEFAAVLADLTLDSGMRVLDVSSPQWLSLHLASIHPDVEFHYVNILPAELEHFSRIAAALGLHNITYSEEDVRALSLADDTFDRVVSVSVIEHVHPEVGGDTRALAEIRRVLKPGGEVVATVPYKERAASVYVDGAVYEREAEEHNFFAREYDRDSLERLIAGSGLTLVDRWLISEIHGALAVDYFEWGPGRVRRLHAALVRSRILLQPLTGRSLDGVLARRHLRVSREPAGRLVNVCARLRKSSM